MDTYADSPNYNDDFYEWACAQAEALRERNFEALDFENLAEEVGDLGIAQQNQVWSRLRQILVHLLKWKFQPKKRSRSWKLTLATQRQDLERALKNSPSLRRKLPGFTADAYASAQRLAAIQMNMIDRDFAVISPKHCPWTIDQILDLDFYPTADSDQRK